MNPTDTKKLISLSYKLKIVTQKINVFEKINVALPKQKEALFNNILKPLYGERSMLQFNVNQIIGKKRRDKDGN